MSYDLVTVTMQVIGFDGSGILDGHMTFYPSDFIWDQSTNEIVVVSPIMFNVAGGFVGNPTNFALLAMDNPTLSKDWAWYVTAGVPGLPSPVPIRKLTVNFAAGANQNLADLMAASTIVA